MEKERGKVRASILAAQARPVPLRVAAALLYDQVAGGGLKRVPEHYVQALNTAALALSQIADIYHVGADGVLRRLPYEVLAQGEFIGGGEAYRTRSGDVYRKLSMRRIDVLEASAALRKARSAIELARAER